MTGTERKWILQTLRRRLFSREFLVTICAIFVLARTMPVWAQSPEAAPTPAPSSSFEVASIKPNHSVENRMMIMNTADGLTVNGMTVKTLMEFAYDIKDFQVSGGPGWIDSDRYDIQAKMDDATIEALKKLPPEQMIEQRRALLRSLLADRFKLKVTPSSKELPIYALVVAKNGSKLTQSAAATSSNKGPMGQMRMGPGELTGTAVTMSFLAGRIAREVGREVVDKTGLQGNYDFTLHWAPERPASMPGGPADGGPAAPGAAAAPPDSSGPSIFTALQEQLGLKLESQKGPVKIVVIDSIEKPSED